MSIPCTRDQWDYVGSLAEERQWGPPLGLVAGIPVIATGKNYGDGTIEQLEPSGVFTIKSETSHRYSDTSAYEVNGWSLLYDNAISGSPMLFQGHWRPAVRTVIRSKWASSSFYVATYFRSLETRHKYSDFYLLKSAQRTLTEGKYHCTAYLLLVFCLELPALLQVNEQHGTTILLHLSNPNQSNRRSAVPTVVLPLQLVFSGLL